MIELINIEKKYPTPHGEFLALKNVHLTVKAGEIFGVIGKSGAGKSTLIRCINLLERPSSGNVYVDGQDLTKLSSQQLNLARHQIGMIFQHFNLLTSRNVFANVALPLELIGLKRKEIAARVNPLLELTGLWEKRTAYPTQLSGGQKQRVAIARALASQPQVLLCDEATSALDWPTTLTILELLKDINAKLNVTIFLITHEMDVIKQLCDRVALLDQGEIVEQGEIFDFFTKPKTTLAKTLLKSYLNHDLPHVLQNKLTPHALPNKNPLLRIVFFGPVAHQPLIANLMQNFNVRCNIWQANMETLKTGTLGTMLMEIMSQQIDVATTIHYLEQQGVFVEQLGYV